LCFFLGVEKTVEPRRAQRWEGGGKEVSANYANGREWIYSHGAIVVTISIVTFWGARLLNGFHLPQIPAFGIWGRREAGKTL
jgi:hypothetical protein